MRYFLVNIFGVLIGTFVILSTVTGIEMQVGGKLYYSVSDGVYELNLSTLQRKYVYKNPSLLGGQIAYVKEGVFIAGASGHLLLVEKDGLSRELAYGHNAIFNETFGKVLFFSGHDLTGPRPRLFSAELDVKQGIKSIQQVDIGPFGAADSPIQISDHEIVYKRDGVFDRLFKYDIAKNQISELQIENCRPLAWRATTRQIICSRIRDVGYFATSIDGKEIVELPQLKGIALGPYLPTDQLLGSRMRLGLSGEESELVIYDFRTGKMQKIVSHVPFSPGTSFWTP
jgi:hypothetical protein